MSRKDGRPRVTPDLSHELAATPEEAEATAYAPTSPTPDDDDLGF